MGAFVTDSIADNELVFVEALNVINNKIAAIEARLDAAGL